jgi:putative transcriptional regulator
VLDGVYLSTDEDLLRKLIRREKPMDGLRIFIGYTGWGPGQLEAEIARGDWTLEPADAGALFAHKSEQPWPGRPTPDAGSRT